MPATINITGVRFGRLTAISSHGKNKQKRWLCLCDCGNQSRVSISQLTTGKTSSCGCLQKERTSAARSSHRMSDTPLYNVWKGIKKRCLNTKDKAWHCYGGRGITVCDRWRMDFAAFVSDMGPRPRGMTIERIDNDGPYSPQNCRWATRMEQMNNLRKSVFVKVGSETLTLSQWGRKFGLHAGTIRLRIRAGWGNADAVSTPSKRSAVIK